MTAKSKTGKILEIRWARVRLTDKEGNQTDSFPQNAPGRVICPDCKKKPIMHVLRDTRGVNLPGWCSRCKKQFWLDITDN